MALIKTCFRFSQLNQFIKPHKPFIHQSIRPVISSQTIGWRLCHNNTDIDNKDEDIERLFLDSRVQTILYRLTGFNPQKLFTRKAMKSVKSPKYQFLTQKELENQLSLAEKLGRSRLQMPPVMKPKPQQTAILSKDFPLQGYLASNLICVDSSTGYSDRERIIVVRETNGILRKANSEERYRMNQMFFPIEERLIEKPKMFDDLEKVFERHDYEFVLNRVCLQYEPDDPEFIRLCHLTYEDINIRKKFETLRSTRHFGPMAFHLAFYNKIDNLLQHFILNEAIGDALDLCQLYYIIHPKDSLESESNDPLFLIKYYINEDSTKKSTLELSLQKYEEIQREKQSIIENIDRVHGRQ